MFKSKNLEVEKEMINGLESDNVKESLIFVYYYWRTTAPDYRQVLWQAEIWIWLTHPQSSIVTTIPNWSNNIWLGVGVRVGVEWLQYMKD